MRTFFQDFTQIRFLSSAEQQLWLSLFAVAAFVLLSYLLVLRTKGPRKGLRLVFLTLVVGALLAAGLRPALRKRVEVRQAIIVSEGARLSFTDSLIEELQADYVFYPKTMSEAFKNRSAENCISYSTIAEISKKHPEVRHLHVVGNGLSIYNLDRFKGKQLSFHLNALPQGINELYYTKKLRLGDSLKISGRLNADTKGKLFLQGPSRPVDSLVFQKGESAFSFHELPKTTGKQIYHLKWISGNNTQEYVLPFQVFKRSKMRIVALEAFPTFEGRYLKKWLQEQGHKLLWRSSISRDKFHYDFINRQAVKFSGINRDLLAKTDLLLLDAESWRQLRNYEKRILRRSVEQGLGVLLMADEAWLSGNLQGLFDDFQFQKQLLRASLTPSKSHTSLSYRFESSFLSDIQSLPLQQNPEGEWVAAARLKGLGKAGVELSQQTYGWLLQGDSLYYAQYWSALLSKLSRPEKPDLELNFSQLPTVGEPWQLYAAIGEKSSLQAEVAMPDSSTFTLHWQQLPAKPGNFQATLWPLQAGWHRFHVENARASAEAYVFDTTDWATVRTSHRIQANRAWNKAATDANTSEIYSYQAIPLYYFYLLFLFAASGLWLEEKF